MKNILFQISLLFLSITCLGQNSELNTKNSNKNLVREITLILIIKVIILMVIKNIWFDAPTIPKDFDIFW